MSTSAIETSTIAVILWRKRKACEIPLHINSSGLNPSEGLADNVFESLSCTKIHKTHKCKQPITIKHIYGQRMRFYWREPPIFEHKLKWIWKYKIHKKKVSEKKIYRNIIMQGYWIEFTFKSRTPFNVFFRLQCDYCHFRVLLSLWLEFSFCLSWREFVWQHCVHNRAGIANM